MSFGLHVVVMMGTFYAFGHVLGLAVSSNRALVSMQGALGLLGTNCLMLTLSLTPLKIKSRYGLGHIASWRAAVIRCWRASAQCAALRAVRECARPSSKDPLLLSADLFPQYSALISSRNSLV